MQLVPHRLDELELLADRLGELDRLQPQLEDRRGDLEQLRAEGGAETRPVGRRLAQCHRAPPGGAADDPGRERDLSERPPPPPRPPRTRPPPAPRPPAPAAPRPHPPPGARPYPLAGLPARAVPRPLPRA